MTLPKDVTEFTLDLTGLAFDDDEEEEEQNEEAQAKDGAQGNAPGSPCSAHPPPTEKGGCST